MAGAYRQPGWGATAAPGQSLPRWRVDKLRRPSYFSGAVATASISTVAP